MIDTHSQINVAMSNIATNNVNCNNNTANNVNLSNPAMTNNASTRIVNGLSMKEPHHLVKELQEQNKRIATQLKDLT